MKFECVDGKRHEGRWVTIKGSEGVKGHKHAYEMADTNLRECECGRGQYIEWVRPATKRKTKGRDKG